MIASTKSSPDTKEPIFIAIGIEDRVEVITVYGDHGRRSSKTIVIYPGQDKQSSDCTPGQIRKEKMVRDISYYLSLPGTLEGSLAVQRRLSSGILRSESVMQTVRNYEQPGV